MLRQVSKLYYLLDKKYNHFIELAYIFACNAKD